MQKQPLQKREENQDNVAKLKPKHPTGWGQQCWVEAAPPAVVGGQPAHLVCPCARCINQSQAPGLGEQDANRAARTIWKGE